jgi:hypothetical protein
MEEVLRFAFDVGRVHPAEWVHYARAYVYVPAERTFVNIAHGDHHSDECFNDIWYEIRPDDTLTIMVDHFRSNNLILEADVVTSQNSPWPSIEEGLNGAMLHLTKEAFRTVSEQSRSNL